MQLQNRVVVGSPMFACGLLSVLGQVQRDVCSEFLLGRRRSARRRWPRVVLGSTPRSCRQTMVWRRMVRMMMMLVLLLLEMVVVVVGGRCQGCRTVVQCHRTRRWGRTASVVVVVAIVTAAAMGGGGVGGGATATAVVGSVTVVTGSS